ncbi:hypothetical protein [Streptomyces xanthochromogenes]|uniref:hypothetical protein n=1 Tax=Streptomyces xanthochromogenes TaxID=67384 RepID=UPI002F3EB772
MTTDLDGIRARVAAASPLPWVIVPRSCTDHGDYYDLHGGRASDDPAVWWLNEIATHHEGDEGVPLDRADAEFIVNAREDVPALLAEVARLNGELVEMRAKVRICEQQTARLDAENTRLRKENDDLAIGLGIADGPRRQLNDVIDVTPDLTAALTRHEVIA